VPPREPNVCWMCQTMPLDLGPHDIIESTRVVTQDLPRVLVCKDLPILQGPIFSFLSALPKKFSLDGADGLKNRFWAAKDEKR
jgi:hypothetical protein